MTDAKSEHGVEGLDDVEDPDELDELDELDDDQADAPRRPAIAVLAIVSLVAIVVVALVAYSFGRLSTLAPEAEAPSDTSAEAGFARDMQEHHHQAVEMSRLIRDRTDDPEVRTLAWDIITAQSGQAGQLYGWLQEWGLNQAGSQPSMTWMTLPTLSGSPHEHAESGSHEPGQPMPGMATDEQLQELSDATGVEAERLYLELMIAHHQGGVEMAEAYLARGDRPSVVGLAENIVMMQQSEIDLMTEMLAERQ
ncbi:DUF305 domain-containing protein [Agromyces seonyuensis]|uniref:DUF305 domain-containing protein n=1 Tax=Agromyces seonyuensis TaxID=2662446 RepID=A0A6I4NYW8_9MICO|nr:DUF305 domain-containing protein [Agromyces seonyuensis]MWB97625.1 DUF305 domain-containing protein [Agromyces seonyuensis]